MMKMSAGAVTKDTKEDSKDSKDSKSGGSSGGVVISLTNWQSKHAVQQLQDLIKLKGQDALDALNAKPKPSKLLPDPIAKQLTEPNHQIAFYALCEMLPDVSQPLLVFALAQRNWEVGKAVNALLEPAMKVTLIEKMNVCSVAASECFD
jgi:hypothetical protein